MIHAIKVYSYKVVVELVLNVVMLKEKVQTVNAKKDIMKIRMITLVKYVVKIVKGNLAML